MGDGAIVEFASVMDAVNCGVSVRQFRLRLAKDGRHGARLMPMRNTICGGHRSSCKPKTAGFADRAKRYDFD
jgi:hypothetical protein